MERFAQDVHRMAKFQSNAFMNPSKVRARWHPYMFSAVHIKVICFAAEVGMNPSEMILGCHSRAKYQTTLMHKHMQENIKTFPGGPHIPRVCLTGLLKGLYFTLNTVGRILKISLRHNPPFLKNFLQAGFRLFFLFLLSVCVKGKVDHKTDKQETWFGLKL